MLEYFHLGLRGQCGPHRRRCLASLWPLKGERWCCPPNPPTPRSLDLLKLPTSCSSDARQAGKDCVWLFQRQGLHKGHCSGTWQFRDLWPPRSSLGSGAHLAGLLELSCGHKSNAVLSWCEIFQLQHPTLKPSVSLLLNFLSSPSTPTHTEEELLIGSSSPVIDFKCSLKLPS